MSSTLRLAVALSFTAALVSHASVARAETLRLTCDNFVEEVFVDGVALGLGANANDWTSPDDYALDLGPGAHTIAFRASDDASTVAGCMLVLFADDGTTPIVVSSGGVLRTVRIDPGTGWQLPGFDASSWPFATACANPGPWGSTSLAWGRSVGADMVWGPTTCAGAELGARRWFRWGVVVPECFDTSACDDANGCTTDTCAAGFCAHAALGAGTACTGGVCNGVAAMPLCVACIDSSPGGVDLGCAMPESYCRTAGGGAPRCEPCLDTTSGGTDLGCGGTTPACVTSGIASSCAACESDAQCADGDECTANACTSGMCSTMRLPFGTTCSAGLCDATGACSSLAVRIDAPMDGATIGDATPTYGGTATPGATVIVVVDGTSIGTATAAADGTWSLTPSSPLSEGRHAVIASVSAAGGTATDEARFDVDLSTFVTITAPADGATTADATPEIRGTGEPGATITVSVDGLVVGMVMVAADGTWVLTTSTPLSNGAHTAEADATDDVGNTAHASSTFTVDARTSVTIESPASGTTTNDATPTISGTAAPGATVEVRVDGVLIGTTTAAADGTWSVAPTDPLADGPHTAEATATDRFGNVAADTSTFTVDTATSIDITDADATMVRGTGEPGATIVVVIDGRSYGAVTVAADGTWAVPLDEPLGPGSHDVIATVTDGAGNVATDTTTVTVDEPSPDAGVADAGTMLDGGTSDAASLRDAGRAVDAGAADAGTMDAGTTTDDDDAGTPPGGVAGGACGCATQTDGRARASWLVGLGLLALTLARRRRR